MPVLGTLTTMVTADTSGFSAGMSEAAKTAQKFEKESGNAIAGAEEHLSGFRKSLGSFREITELAFGFHVGRMFFEQLHHGLMRGVEGFGEAQKAGEGFSDSVADGVRSALGMHTAFEQINEDAKKFAEGGHASAKAWEEARQAMEAAAGHLPGRDFPNLPSAVGSAEQGLIADLKAKQTAALPFHSDIDRLKDKIRRDDTDPDLQDELSAVRKRAERFFKQEEAANAALSAFHAEAERRQQIAAEAEENHISDLEAEHTERETQIDATRQNAEAAKAFAKQWADDQAEIHEAYEEEQAAVRKRTQMEEEARKDREEWWRAEDENARHADDFGSGRARYDGLTDFAHQLQLAALGGGNKNASTLDEQKKQTDALHEMVNKVKGVDTLFTFSNVA